MKSLNEFVKKKKFLLCVDSDGCAMDTMEIKHRRCFAPCFVQEFVSKAHQEEMAERWCDVNLYENTRGINRFKGLAEMLSGNNIKDVTKSEAEKYIEWTKSADELSEAALSLLAEKYGGVFSKALCWSKAVNAEIERLPTDAKEAFDGVKDALEKASKYCDIAVVSGANAEAVAKEWERCELAPFVDVLTAQSDGSKAECIRRLMSKGYDKNAVFMAGDAQGDLAAANANGVWFYPILTGHECESWEKFFSVYLDIFLKGDYGGCEFILTENFLNNFKGGKKV